MAIDLFKALDAKIAQVEGQLSALRQARAALSGRVAGGNAGGGLRKRRRFTAAQRAEISRRMKAAWAKRRASK
jgi:hypothetical protein